MPEIVSLAMLAMGVVLLAVSSLLRARGQGVLGFFLGFAGVLLLPLGVFFSWSQISQLLGLKPPVVKLVAVGFSFLLGVVVFLLVTVRTRKDSTEKAVKEGIKKLGGSDRTVAAGKVSTLVRNGDNKFTIQANVRQAGQEVELGALLNAAINREEVKKSLASGAVVSVRLQIMYRLWRKGDISDQDFKEEYEKLIGKPLPQSFRKKMDEFDSEPESDVEESN